jgi:hypothetical protein
LEISRIVWKSSVRVSEKYLGELAQERNQKQYFILLKGVTLIFHANSNERNYEFIMLQVVQICYLLMPTISKPIMDISNISHQ